MGVPVFPGCPRPSYGSVKVIARVAMSSLLPPVASAFIPQAHYAGKQRFAQPVGRRFIYLLFDGDMVSLRTQLRLRSVMSTASA